MPRTAVTFDGFVHAEGGQLLDGHCRPIVLRGVGLGNWLLPEGYMWRFPREGPQSPRQIEAFIVSLVGDDAAAAFWRRFRDSFIGEADIERIAAFGFDHVRLPMNARLLMSDDGAFLEDGFTLIDRLIGWCRQQGLWVVLDLHGAPGGQTGTNIDDSPRGLPDLFLVGGRYREQTIALWTELARRYRDETVVAAYDLLNEPLPHEYGDRFAGALVELYRDLTAAVRAVDPNHLITYEGTHWSTDWTVLREPYDPNSLLQFHKYWSPPDRASLAPYLETGQRLGLPLYMGEGGENDTAWLQTAFGLYDDLGISWNLWPWKKLATRTSPVSVAPPAGWDAIVASASGDTPAPSTVAAIATLDALIDAMRFEACELRLDVLAALFHRAPVRLAAEAFTAGGGGGDPRLPATSFRAGEGVTLRRRGDVAGDPSWAHEDRGKAEEPRFEVVLPPGAWVEYRVELGEPGTVCVGVLVETPGPVPSIVAVLLNGVALPVTATGDRLQARSGHLSAGTVSIRLEGGASGAVVLAVEVAPDVQVT